MQTMKEFGDTQGKLSLRQFWLATAPTFVGVLLLTILVILWKRPSAETLRSRVWEIWSQSWCGVFIREKVWPCLCCICRPLWKLICWPCLRLICWPCAGDCLPQHHATSAAGTAPPQQAPQNSGSGQGGSIQAAMGPVQVSSQQPPPRSPSQQQGPPAGAHSMITSSPNGTSLPPSSVGRPGAPSPLPTARRSGTHTP